MSTKSIPRELGFPLGFQWVVCRIGEVVEVPSITVQSSFARYRFRPL